MRGGVAAMVKPNFSRFAAMTVFAPPVLDLIHQDTLVFICRRDVTPNIGSKDERRLDSVSQVISLRTRTSRRDSAVVNTGVSSRIGICIRSRSVVASGNGGRKSWLRVRLDKVRV
jgi:hypothetical protein